MTLSELLRAMDDCDERRQPITDSMRDALRSLARDVVRERDTLCARVGELEATLSTASQFWVLRPTESRPSPMTIDRCAQLIGPDRWAVRCRGNVLSRGGEWEWEPSPSNRDDDFLARCRFGTYDEAKAAATVLGSPK